jgi:hypothetical protein
LTINLIRINDIFWSIYTKQDFCVTQCHTTASNTVRIDPNLVRRCCMVNMAWHRATWKSCFMWTNFLWVTHNGHCM